MKNIKKVIVCVFTIISVIVMLNLVACSENPNNKKFNSFKKYKDFSNEVVSIEVTWDLSGSLCEFTIDNAEQIDDVIELYNQLSMENVGKEPTAGDNGYINFVYSDGRKTSASLLIIYDEETKCYYSYPDTTIYNYIKQIGIDKKVIS